MARGGTYVQDAQREVGRSLLTAQGSTELRVGAMGRPGGQVMSNNSRTDQSKHGSTTLTGKGSTVTGVTEDSDKHRSGPSMKTRGCPQITKRTLSIAQGVNYLYTSM